MSAPEETKEQTEVVMDDAEKAMPSPQQEVVFSSFSILDKLLMYVIVYIQTNILFRAGGNCKE